MSRNLFAFVTFGNVQFTKLTVESIRDTVQNSYDIFAVVGKPGDSETLNWLATQPDIQFKIHTENMGFPYGVNDIYDFAWKQNNYDNLVLLGNDVILYPYAGDSLINFANASSYQVISGLQYDVRDLTREYPDTRQYFQGDDCIIEDFSAKPWEKFGGYSKDLWIADMQLYDIQNFCLYKKSVFDKIGYTDVNFYPAYFIDNDYARRIVLANIRCCTLTNARFFHFWSRTIKQGSGGSTSHYFDNNRKYYKNKWGGDVGHEKNVPNLTISSREGEERIIANWRRK